MNEDRVDVDFGADTESPAPYICSTCGAELSEDMDFCPQCGLQIMPPPSDGLLPPDALLPPNAPQLPSDVPDSDSFDLDADMESPAPYICSTCGAGLSEDMVFCPQCGLQIMPLPPEAPQPPSEVATSGSLGWGLLGFFLPIVGLILFLVWRNSKPRSAQAAGLGALIGFILSIGRIF